MASDNPPGSRRCATSRPSELSHHGCCSAPKRPSSREWQGRSALFGPTDIRLTMLPTPQASGCAPKIGGFQRVPNPPDASTSAMRFNKHRSITFLACSKQVPNRIHHLKMKWKSRPAPCMWTAERCYCHRDGGRDRVDGHLQEDEGGGSPEDGHLLEVLAAQPRT